MVTRIGCVGLWREELFCGVVKGGGPNYWNERMQGGGIRCRKPGKGYEKVWKTARFVFSPQMIPFQNPPKLYQESNPQQQDMFRRSFQF